MKIHVNNMAVALKIVTGLVVIATTLIGVIGILRLVLAGH
jgi:hypothetical protein